MQRQADWQLRLVNAEAEVSEKQIDRLEIDLINFKSQVFISNLNSYASIISFTSIIAIYDKVSSIANDL